MCKELVTRIGQRGYRVERCRRSRVRAGKIVPVDRQMPRTYPIGVSGQMSRVDQRGQREWLDDRPRCSERSVSELAIPNRDDRSGGDARNDRGAGTTRHDAINRGLPCFGTQADGAGQRDTSQASDNGKTNERARRSSPSPFAHSRAASWLSAWLRQPSRFRDPVESEPCRKRPR